ncbi:MAG: hypothetical protein A2W68_12660 [Betaproteobacteria bacterium RIFCSPLOWO2_02_64_14]|jgi:hypothetical protein|nr:MAG: hypothetical protein A2W68_12660 [Betaproteobacteria bacterium RIFCSPLOWO2_02_64_14]
MITTDTFSRFARRMSATQGCPYVVIAETPNPIRQLDEAAIRTRAEAMIATVIAGLTHAPAEIEAQLKDIAREQIHPRGVVRSAVPV